MEKTIKELRKIGKIHISDSFNLHRTRSLLYSITGNYISKALNIKKNDSELVNVLKWFDDFWIYIEIRFVPKKKKNEIPNIFFSLSIFHGLVEDENKLQLFRAEWDNYDKISYRHPQPHWHIYTDNDRIAFDKTFEEELETEEENPFLDYIAGKGDKIGLNKFHFAMNGQWSEKKTDIHKIVDSNDLVNWFLGLLMHIKDELKYLK